MVGPEFWYLSQFLCHVTLNLTKTSVVISSDLNWISYVGRGRWVMHDGMPYGRNQGQGQGHSREVDRQSPTGLIFIIIPHSVAA